MKKALIWVGINLTVAALLLVGFWVGIQGAKNVALFYIWAVAALSTLFLIDPAKAGKPGRSVPLWVSAPYSIVVVGFLVWHGAIAAGIAWCWGWFMQELAFNAAATEKDNPRLNRR